MPLFSRGLMRDPLAGSFRPLLAGSISTRDTLAVESLRQTFTRSKSICLGRNLESESELLRSVFRKRLHFGAHLDRSKPLSAAICGGPTCERQNKFMSECSLKRVLATLS